MDNNQNPQVSRQAILEALSDTNPRFNSPPAKKKSSLAPLLIGITALVAGLFAVVAVLIPSDGQSVTTGTEVTQVESQNVMSVPVIGFLEKVATLKFDEAQSYVNKDSILGLNGIKQSTLDKFAGDETLWSTCQVLEGQYKSRQVAQDNKTYTAVYVPVTCDTEGASKKQLTFDVRKSSVVEEEWLIYDIVAKNYEL